MHESYSGIPNKPKKFGKKVKPVKRLKSWYIWGNSQWQCTTPPLHQYGNARVMSGRVVDRTANLFFWSAGEYRTRSFEWGGHGTRSFCSHAVSSANAKVFVTSNNSSYRNDWRLSTGDGCVCWWPVILLECYHGRWCVRVVCQCWGLTTTWSVAISIENNLLKFAFQSKEQKAFSRPNWNVGGSLSSVFCVSPERSKPVKDFQGDSKRVEPVCVLAKHDWVRKNTKSSWLRRIHRRWRLGCVKVKWMIGRHTSQNRSYASV